MAKYRYNSVSFAGQPVDGELTAHSEDELRQLLQADGLVLTTAQVVTTAEPQALRLLSGRRRELVPFTRQMATMLSAGVGIDRILRVLGRQARSKSWRSTLMTLSDSIRSGDSLSAALAGHPEDFNSLYVSLVRAGETSGELPMVLERLASYLEGAERVNRKVKAAFLYPLAVLAVSIIVVLVLMIYIIPIFQEMFTNLHAELPRMTKLVIDISGFFRRQTLLIIAVLVLGSVLLWRLAKSNRTRIMLDRWLLRLPLAGNLIIKSQLAHFCRTCETLLSGGVQLPEAIMLASTAVSNVKIQTELQQGLSALKNGQALHTVWEDGVVLPPIMAEMIQVGEETGKLARVFGKLAQMFTDEVETITPALTAILEPVLIVIVGVLVAGILISMYLPLFELIGQLG